MRAAEQWASITGDLKDAFDAICAALHCDSCDLRRQIWEQRFHRIPRNDQSDLEYEHDHQGRRRRITPRCQTCGAEVPEPAVCSKAPEAAKVWQPSIGDVVWVVGQDDPFLVALRIMAGEEQSPSAVPLYREHQSALVSFVVYAIRVRDRLHECMRIWPLYEPVPDHPRTPVDDRVRDSEGRLYPVCYHRNRARLHTELLPREIKDVSKTPLARAINEAMAMGTLTVLDRKLQRLDEAIRAYAGCLLESNDATGSELLELNEAISALMPYTNTGGAHYMPPNLEQAQVALQRAAIPSRQSLENRTPQRSIVDIIDQSKHKRKRAGGRPPVSEPEGRKRERLVEQWARAKAAGVRQKDFIINERVSLEYLTRCMNWLAQRRRRNES